MGDACRGGPFAQEMSKSDSARHSGPNVDSSFAWPSLDPRGLGLEGGPEINRDGDDDDDVWW